MIPEGYRVVNLRCGKTAYMAEMAPAMFIGPFVLGGYLPGGETPTNYGEPQLWRKDGKWQEDGAVHPLDIIGFPIQQAIA